MPQLKIKVGSTEFSANGGEEFIAQERGAFVEYLKRETGGEKVAPADQQQNIVIDSPVNARCVTQRLITPNTLREAIEKKQFSSLLQPFDEIDIPMDTGETVTAVCAYVEPDWARFVLKDCVCEGFMNEENTNKTGYFKSTGRERVLTDILPHFPLGWRMAFKPRKIVETINGEKTEYKDLMWLPSATDVFGLSKDGYWPEERDSFQLPIFKRERNRVKEYGDNGTCFWGLRSVHATHTTSFCYVGTSGSYRHFSACYSLGFAPGFDI